MDEILKSAIEQTIPKYILISPTQHLNRSRTKIVADIKQLNTVRPQGT